MNCDEIIVRSILDVFVSCFWNYITGRISKAEGLLAVHILLIAAVCPH